MAILNIRGVADELHQAVKVKAAQEGLTITEFVVRVLAASVVEVKAGTGVLERQMMPNARRDPALTREHRAETSAVNSKRTAEPVRKSVGEQTGTAETGNTPRGSRGAGQPASSNPSKIGQPHHPNCSCVRCKPPKKEQK